MIGKSEGWFASFAINLFLAVATAGLALAAKAIHSKVSTGTFSFFASTTGKQEAVSNIQQALDEVTLAAPTA